VVARNTVADGAPTALETLEPLPEEEWRELAPGLAGVRLRLPFALDHVHLWRLDDGAGWTIVDTGLGDDRTRDFWRAQLDGPLAGRPVRRVVATHFHPDHMGQAGWLCAATGAPLWASRTDWLYARLLAEDQSPAFVEAGRAFDHRAGLAAEQVEARAARGNLYRTRVTPPPATYRRLVGGDVLEIDGRRWQVVIGRGHAPEMLCLFDAEAGVLIAADQVLPRISPNVSVWPSEPDANPLADFLDSLAVLRRLPGDCLVLPSHGRPFRGLHRRIDQLVRHHEERLDRALEACARPATAVEVMAVLFERRLDAHQLSFAVGESVAHLNHLIARGELERDLDDAGRHLYCRRR